MDHSIPETYIENVQQALLSYTTARDATGIDKHNMTIEPVESDVPTWTVTMGLQTAKVSLYDIEERRSISTPATPGLNEQGTTQDAVKSWIQENFH